MSFRIPRRDFARLLVQAVLLAIGVGSVSAVTYTWQGGGANENWTTGTNWIGDVVPTNSLTLTDLIFGNTAFDAPEIDVPYGIHSLTFIHTASAYAFGSGPLTIGAGGIIQNAVNAETFNAEVILGADQAWGLPGGAGQLTFNGGVDTTDSARVNHVLTLAAPTAGGSGSVLSGVISGGGSLVKRGPGTVTLLGASTYTGATTVNAGTLAVGGSIGATSAVYVNAGGTLAVAGTGTVTTAGAATLNLTGAAGSLATLTLADTRTINAAGGTFLNGYSTLTQTGGTANVGQVVLSDAGTYNLNGGTLVTSGITSNANGTGSAGTFNFNGGTLQPTDDGLVYLQKLTALNVRAGGAVFSGGSGGGIRIDQPLHR